MELKHLRTDPGKIKEGTWISYLGVRWLVASWTSPGVQAELLRLQKPHLNVEGKITDTKVLLTIVAEVMSTHTVNGWDGLTEGGEPVPHSPEKALEMLSDAGLTHLREYLLQASNEIGNFLAQQEEAVSEN